ncbi:hypothetical protein SKAU_G00241570 [Synaphobranchus kaupii]|uniref:Uncharacterized protein n=1 Tax=Synaphobranchus kaupii TaxID=118154 RepID=A0A9Q1F7M6_SYNKA|nr:hypothetical protein SKAU_G00241570 [Synaphobranchus kaupii]
MLANRAARGAFPDDVTLSVGRPPASYKPASTVTRGQGSSERDPARERHTHRRHPNPEQIPGCEEQAGDCPSWACYFHMGPRWSREDIVCCLS